MKVGFDFTEYSPTDAPPPIRITIIYEDFASGTRARRFAERLAVALNRTCLLAESIWRSELLAYPSIAKLAARTAGDCDYLIVSLSGDRILLPATRGWIEEQLDGAARRGTWLIGLLGAARGRSRILNGNRRYLRTICAAKGVAFFSLAALEPPQGEFRSPRDGEKIDEASRVTRLLELLPV